MQNANRTRERGVVRQTPLLVLLVLLTGPVQAQLMDRGGGLIYDTALNVTWLQDANFAKTSGFSPDGHMVQSVAQAWAESLAYFDPVRNQILTGWRLPTVGPIDGVALKRDFAFDGTSEVGINISDPKSELAHLFYVTLGNSANSGNLDTGPFKNVATSEHFGDWYWTSSTYPYSSDSTRYYFDFASGMQNVSDVGNAHFAWVLRNGDIAPVPSPSPLLLLSASLGILGISSRQRRH